MAKDFPQQFPVGIGKALYQMPENRYNSSMKNFFPYLTICLLAGSLVACVSNKVQIPEDLKPLKIIQLAQEATDRNRYNVALQYYQALQERNLGNDELVCTAEYEIAFIRYKQKKYVPAREQLEALLQRYNAPDVEFLPPQFRVLAQKVIEQINAKENKHRLRITRKSTNEDLNTW